VHIGAIWQKRLNGYEWARDCDAACFQITLRNLVVKPLSHWKVSVESRMRTDNTDRRDGDSVNDSLTYCTTARRDMHTKHNIHSSYTRHYKQMCRPSYTMTQTYDGHVAALPIRHNRTNIKM